MLKYYLDTNNKEEVMEKIIYIANYLSGITAVIVVRTLISSKS